MEFDLNRLGPAACYKMLASVIVPRPIAWITTRALDGTVNAAPFSFFNMMGSDPPTLAVGLMPRGPGVAKDTAANILATAEFAVHLVDEPHAEAMNLTCIDAPPGVDELALAGLETRPATRISPPLIAQAPVALECRMLASVVTGPLQTVVIGQVVVAHIRDSLVLDPGRCYIDTEALAPIARLHGAGGYLRSTDRFDMARPSWAAWQARHGAPDQP